LPNSHKTEAPTRFQKKRFESREYVGQNSQSKRERGPHRWLGEITRRADEGGAGQATHASAEPEARKELGHLERHRSA